MMVFDTSSLYRLLKDGHPEALHGGCTLQLACFEMGNLLWKQIYLAKVLSGREGQRVYSYFLKVLAQMRIVHPDYIRALDIASRLGVSFYDAAFVQAAEALRLPLVTEDSGLQKKAGRLIKIRSAQDVIA